MKEPEAMNERTLSAAELLKKIKQCIEVVEPQAEIILFGSRARGDERPTSDWDILILTPYPIDLKGEQKFRHKLFDIELEYGQAISTFVYSRSDWDTRHHITPLYQSIKREGIVL